ncbi:CAP domain-containing protein [Streptomyces sp. S.PB5]|uniref:CAP domain-containing protein n=1 Tax=Streptomyces sp. S.PB5 TaxID=3020844 RepID=UPI0025B24D42|nr:CAP domain-containing protein [Streptomyces sp. S.PB5]MDN3025127.1 CAP domain-containing protein [Streptomyces sp. S.PB5]
MGRHRRSAAGRAATGRATGVTETDGSYTSGYDRQHSYDYDPQHSYGLDQQFSYDFEADARGHHTGEYPVVGIAPYLNPEAHVARSEAYLYATDDDYAWSTGTASTAMFPSEGFSPGDGGPRRGGGSGRRRKKKVVTPVKTGLLGVSAAVAIGTVAVATGVVPGLDNYKLGGGSNSDKVQAANSPTNSATEQGGTSGSADESRDDEAASRAGGRTASPTPSASASTAAPSEAPSEKPTATPSKKPKTTPSQKERTPPKKTAGPVTVSAEAQAAAEVLKLVNEERAKVGCSAVAANSELAKLAEAFSEAMAAEGFFDHTDPSGETPWDRAEALGITSLGGENIARGQATAAAVMEAWMSSPGHKANILNCDFKTLGVGVHFGSGGPWWTQDFGY